MAGFFIPDNCAGNFVPLRRDVGTWRCKGQAYTTMDLKKIFVAMMERGKNREAESRNHALRERCERIVESGALEDTPLSLV